MTVSLDEMLREFESRCDPVIYKRDEHNCNVAYKYNKFLKLKKNVCK
jgi:hypothetical protein